MLAWEPLLVVLVPGITAMLLSFFLEPFLRKLVRPGEAQEEDADAWYLERG